MDKIKCIRTHLNKYGKEKYRIEGGNDIKESGMRAFKLFKELSENINKELNNKKVLKFNQWQNSGNISDYFWTQFKDNNRKKSSSNISLFARKDFFEICLEWDNKKAVESDNDISMHNSYIKYIREWINKRYIDNSTYYIEAINNNLKGDEVFKLNEFDFENYIVKENTWLRIGKKFSKLSSDIEFQNDAIKTINELNYLYNKTCELNNNIDFLEESVNKIKKIESETEKLDYIKGYIKSKGYTYADEIIDNLYLSLRTKPFVILSGISGTGKSKFVKLFAEAIGATVNNGRFNLIPVRPDWSDDSELIGYRDIEGKFKPGIITSIAKKAMENKNEPYFICLDEMNLARVEYYFSTVLSLMETREFINGEIKTNRLLAKENFGDNSEAYNIYGDVYIPENIYIIGTVNMDETTFPFSNKVLDRANTIEFNEVNLDYAFDQTLEKVLENRVYSNYLLRSPYVKLEQCKDNKEIAYRVINDLKNINKILMEENYHFAYRVRDEIIFFVINAVNSGLMTYEMAMDYSIMQKILPKVSGSSKEVPKILINLFNSLNGTSFIYDDIAYGSVDIKEFEIKKKIYEISSNKIIYMIKRYVRDGFTGFWQ